ncbi:MAG TPA: hypothetical protein VJ810_12535 [Blastocatellia bacterium]|nr:hypothetical protein [Blastocatellia bacterium]
MRIEKAINLTQRAFSRRRQSFNRLLAAFFVNSLVLLAQGRALAQTTDTTLGQGIGTFVADASDNGANIQINTSVAAVTYANPTRVHRAGLNYFEVTGSIRGTGWGGEWADLTGPAPILSANARYSYDIPFVLRWAQNWDGTLVYYSHGRYNLGLLTLADSFLGAANEGRRLEVEGGFISDAVLSPSRGFAFFAPNLNGLKRDGGFSIIALEGPFAGQPLMATIDAPIARDLARVAERLLAKLTGKPVARTIGTGHSAGALVMQFLNGGASTNLDDGRRLFTGGDFVLPYDPTSGLIFDGVIPIAGSSFRLHPQFPMAAPMMMVCGQADYSGVDTVHHASRLLRAGVAINSKLWIYQARNLTHNFAEIVESAPNINRLLLEVFGVESNADGDRMQPVMAAMIENMAELLKRGATPPRSRIDGRGVDTDGNGVPDAISFPQANGQSTQFWPFVDDPAIDTFIDEQIPTSVPGLAARYLEVLAVLNPEPALSLPQTSCRLGGFRLSVDARLSPFEDFFAHWRSIGNYRACGEHTMNQLSQQRLYDRRLGEPLP